MTADEAERAVRECIKVSKGTMPVDIVVADESQAQIVRAALKGKRKAKVIGVKIEEKKRRAQGAPYRGC